MILYVLYRIEDDRTTTPVSTHPTVEAGVMAGVDTVERVDTDYAYALYRGSTRVVSFREGRVGYRAWATRTGRINPCVEDRYDRDEDGFVL